MPEIPDKPVRPAGRVQTQIAGRQAGVGEGFKSFTSDARDSESGRRLKKRRRRPKLHHRRRRTVFLHRWLVLILGSAGITIGVMLVWTLLNQRPSATGAAAGPTPLWPSIGAVKGRSLVDRMLEAETATQLAEVMRDGEISPEEAFQRLQKLKQESEGFEDFRWLGPSSNLCAPSVVAALPTRSGTPLLTVILTLDKDGAWRVDFDAVLGHCSPPIDDWIEGRASEGIVRAVGRKGLYYNGDYRDDEQWACFALTHPRGGATLYGYCPRESIQFRAITNILRSKWELGDGTSHDTSQTATAFGVTLRLRKVARPIGRQYEITEVIADGWVLGELSLEEVLARRSGTD